MIEATASLPWFDAAGHAISTCRETVAIVPVGAGRWERIDGRSWIYAGCLIDNDGMSCVMPSDKIADEFWQEDLDLTLFAAIRLC